MKRIWSALLLGGLLAAVAGGAFWLGHDWRAPAPEAEKGADEAEGTADVQTAVVRRGTITQTVQAYGAMQPKAGSSVVVSIPFDSRVTQVLTTIGAKVEPGAPVVEVGPTPDVQLQLQQAQDTLAAAMHALEQVRPRLKEQLATHADVSAAETAERAARATVQSLKQKGVDTTRQVPAGVAGTVTQISAQPGQMVPAGGAMITIAPSGEMEAIVGVEPSIAGALGPGEELSLHSVYAGEHASEVTGKVHQVDEQINPQSPARRFHHTPARFRPAAGGVCRCRHSRENQHGAACAEVRRGAAGWESGGLHGRGWQSEKAFGHAGAHQ